MHRISLAAGTVPECTPSQTVAAAAAGGFDDSGLWVELDSWDARTSAEVRTMLADTGLGALDVEVGRLRAGQPIDDGQRLLDIGAEVGAQFALFVSTDPDLDRTAEQYAALCAHGASVGVRPVLEFMRFMTVRTFDDALRVVAAAGHPDGAVLIDALHLARGGSVPADVATIDAHLLPYVQLCDAPAEAPTEADLVDEALNGRLLPGDGELPLEELLAVLPADVPFSIELRSAVLREIYRDVAERAAVVARATRRLLALTALERRP